MYVVLIVGVWSVAGGRLVVFGSGGGLCCKVLGVGFWNVIVK